jgi:hypothetical protein
MNPEQAQIVVNAVRLIFLELAVIAIILILK